MGQGHHLINNDATDAAGLPIPDEASFTYTITGTDGAERNLRLLEKWQDRAVTALLAVYEGEKYIWENAIAGMSDEELRILKNVSRKMDRICTTHFLRRRGKL